MARTVALVDRVLDWRIGVSTPNSVRGPVTPRYVEQGNGGNRRQPGAHTGSAQIGFDSSFSLDPQQFAVTDSDLGRTGPVLLGAAVDLDWSVRYAGDPVGAANIFVDFLSFDASESITGVLGSFSCGATFGTTPSCSGSPTFDLDSVDITAVSGGYDITGSAYLEFSGGAVNGDQNFFGPSLGNSLDLNDGLAGQFADLGLGNTLEWSLMSGEESVAVTPVPEPSTAVLIGLGLLGLARSRRSGRPPRRPGGRRVLSQRLGSVPAVPSATTLSSRGRLNASVLRGRDAGRWTRSADRYSHRGGDQAEQAGRCR